MRRVQGGGEEGKEERQKNQLERNKEIYLLL